MRLAADAGSPVAAGDARWAGSCAWRLIRTGSLAVWSLLWRAWRAAAAAAPLSLVDCHLVAEIEFAPVAEAADELGWRRRWARALLELVGGAGVVDATVVVCGATVVVGAVVAARATTAVVVGAGVVVVGVVIVVAVAAASVPGVSGAQVTIWRPGEARTSNGAVLAA